jgi:hypothetical protein
MFVVSFKKIYLVTNIAILCSIFYSNRVWFILVSHKDINFVRCSWLTDIKSVRYISYDIWSKE